MKTLLKICALILIANEVRGVVNVVVNGPRVVMAASDRDWRAVLDIGLELGFIVVLGLAIWTVVRAVQAAVPKYHAIQEELNRVDQPAS